MRVFILCSGRTGSVSVIESCKHITNFTADHESLSKKTGKERFNYPDNHIEADNRLSWQLGHLNKFFGDNAFYVHLKRNPSKVAESHSKRYFHGSMIDAYCSGVKKTPPEIMSKKERLNVAYDYVETVNLNIEMFLEDKSHTMVMELENIQNDFKVFWDRINAQGDWDNAIAEFDNRHNKSKSTLNLAYRFKINFIRSLKFLKMYMQSK